MPKFLDVPTWYGSSSTTPLSLWTTSGTRGQLLKSNGSSSAPTWASFSRTYTSIMCCVFQANFNTESSTAGSTANGFLYVNVPGESINSVSSLWNFLNDNAYDGTYDGTSRTTFFPAIGFAFSRYDNDSVNAVMAIGIAKSGGSAGARPLFKVLRKHFNPLTGVGAASASWEIDTIPISTFDSTGVPLYGITHVVSDVGVS